MWISSFQTKTGVENHAFSFNKRQTFWKLQVLRNVTAAENIWLGKEIYKKTKQKAVSVDSNEFRNEFPFLWNVYLCSKVASSFFWVFLLWNFKPNQMVCQKITDHFQILIAFMSLLFWFSFIYLKKIYISHLFTCFFCLFLLFSLFVSIDGDAWL